MDYLVSLDGPLKEYCLAEVIATPRVAWGEDDVVEFLEQYGFPEPYRHWWVIREAGAALYAAPSPAGRDGTPFYGPHWLFNVTTLTGSSMFVADPFGAAKCYREEVIARKCFDPEASNERYLRDRSWR